MEYIALCPVCGTILSKSTTRYIDGSKCCVYCKDFVKTSKPSFITWFNKSKIALRRKANPRYPGAEASLLSRLIKEDSLQGEHAGQQALDSLNALRTKLENELNRDISKYERYSLIFSVFNTLDQTYGQDFERIQRLASVDIQQPIRDTATSHYKANTFLGTVCKGLERILEIAIARDSGTGEYVRNENTPIWLSEIATELAIINGVIEGYIYLWDKKGKLNVTLEDLQLELRKEDQNRLHDIQLHWSEDDARHIKLSFDTNLEGPSPEEWIQSLKKIIGGSATDTINTLGLDIVEFLQTIDQTHRMEFQHTFSEKLLVLLYLTSLPAHLLRGWAFEDEILKYLTQESQLPTSNILAVLNHLALTKEDILQEHAYPFEFGRKFRLIRRPLPRLDVGTKHVYLLSIAIIGRHFFDVISK